MATDPKPDRTGRALREYGRVIETNFFGTNNPLTPVRVLRRELGSYNQTYGALGEIIVFLVWLWITNLAILLGAEVNAERERSRQLKDGTLGAEREIQLEERSEPKANKRARTV
jgi:hypothetical protein